MQKLWLSFKAVPVWQ